MLMTATPQARRWKVRPELSNWGDFGPDDQLGRLNLLTPAKVREGALEIREGRSFCLSLPLDYPGGKAVSADRGPPVIEPTGSAAQPRYNMPVSRTRGKLFTDLLCDDRVSMTLQYSTQWDGLSHIGSVFDADGTGTPQHVYYNGFRAGTDITGPLDYEHGDAATGHAAFAKSLGIEHMAYQGVQGRGVLVDLFAHFGRERKRVGYDDLMRVMEADGVQVEPGDMLLLHTGLSQLVLDMKKELDEKAFASSCAVLNGRDGKLLQWIHDSGVAIIAADNYAVEDFDTRPFHDCAHALLPLHELCLFKLGIHLGEFWYLSELAAWLRANGRSRFMLTAPPLRLPGAAGSPVTPIATV